MAGYVGCAWVETTWGPSNIMNKRVRVWVTRLKSSLMSTKPYFHLGLFHKLEFTVIKVKILFIRKCFYTNKKAKLCIFKPFLRLCPLCNPSAPSSGTINWSWSMTTTSSYTRTSQEKSVSLNICHSPTTSTGDFICDRRTPCVHGR